MSLLYQTVEQFTFMCSLPTQLLRDSTTSTSHWVQLHLDLWVWVQLRLGPVGLGPVTSGTCGSLSVQLRLGPVGLGPSSYIWDLWVWVCPVTSGICGSGSSCLGPVGLGPVMSGTCGSGSVQLHLGFMGLGPVILGPGVTVQLGLGPARSGSSGSK